ncbi:HNH endonuclease [Xanthomonas sp. NCPPB 3005]|uniref:HNH endonuclease n=1 Tax=Xanthomonas sp. NCPPB 3005 TaxID=3240913 RepID=UPI003517BB20
MFEAEGWCCYLCGCDTPRELMGSAEPNAPELEHVIPLSKGGTHTRDNVRCACRACNLNKGANMPGGEGENFKAVSLDTCRPLICEKNPGQGGISKWQA